jgi:hypothetical protein
MRAIGGIVAVRVLSEPLMPARKNTMTEEERSRRFVEKAKELGADESSEGFDRVLEKMMPPKRGPAPTPSDRRSRRNGKPVSS